MGKLFKGLGCISGKMPEGPLGGPRPGVKTKMVVVVLTDEPVPLDRRPELVRDINNSLRDIDVGPGFKADTVEELEGGTSGGLFSEFFGGDGMDPFQAAGSTGVFMTFSFPALTEDQIDQIVAAVDDATEQNATGFTIGCL